METLAFLLLVTMQCNNTGVVSLSMGIFFYGYVVTTAFSQTRHNMKYWHKCRLEMNEIDRVWWHFWINVKCNLVSNLMGIDEYIY
jgi:hypothetical protein